MDLFRAIFADSDESSSSSSSDENSDEEDPELDRQKSDGKMSISGTSFVEHLFFSPKTWSTIQKNSEYKKAFQ